MIPDKNYMDQQGELQWWMRSILLEWIVQNHEALSLVPETLFLSVNYIDRFLSCRTISIGKLQLVGATALFIAAKYEESRPPSVRNFAEMVDNGYTVAEILKAERFMLSILQFELGWPGPMSFLRRISKADNYDLRTRTLAKYFLEVTIMDERVVGIKPSIIAAAASFLANAMSNNSGWVFFSGCVIEATVC
jgi:G2/mitotic-specific cyclin 3/4